MPAGKHWLVVRMCFSLVETLRKFVKTLMVFM